MRKKINLTVLIFILIFYSGFALTNTIRIAIVDNLMSQKLSSEKYARDYLQGVKAGLTLFKQNNLNIECKAFFYDRNPLSIFKEIKKVVDWKPDVVIGPRSSDKFLLLRKYFKNTLVLSPLASSPEIEDMPKNFRSIVLPDNYSAEIFLQVINTFFPGKKIVLITEADCNSCMRLRSLILYKDRNIDSKMVADEAQFISEDVEKVSVNKLIRNYHKGAVIILLGTSYSSGILISRITNYLGNVSPIYIGGDQWGAWSVSYAGKVSAKFSYEAYRISPMLVNKDSDDYREFEFLFNQLFHEKPPEDTISYHMYHLIKCIVLSLNNHPSSRINLRERILSGYLSMTNQNKYLFTPKTYEVYQLAKDGESKLRDFTVTKEQIES